MADETKTIWPPEPAFLRYENGVLVGVGVTPEMGLIARNPPDPTIWPPKGKRGGSGGASAPLDEAEHEVCPTCAGRGRVPKVVR